MILVYEVIDIGMDTKKLYYVDTNSLSGITAQEVTEELNGQGVSTGSCEINLDLNATLRNMIFTDQMTDADILDLARLYFKASKVSMTSLQFNALMSKNKNKKIKAVGQLVMDNPELQSTKLENFIFPKYAKEIFARIEKADTNSQRSILATLIDILNLKRDVDSKIKKLTRYPKILYFMMIAFLLVFMIALIPVIKETIMSFNLPDINRASKWLYDMSDSAKADPLWFSLKTFAIGYVMYRVLYKIVAVIVKRVPFIYKIGFYRDHALFFGLLSTYLKAGLGRIDALRYAVEVIENKSNRNKMKQIIQDIFVLAEDFADCLKKYNYNQDLYETLVSNRGLTDSETYEEIKNNYTEEMRDRVDAASEYVQPAAMIVIVIVLITLMGIIFSPLMSLMDKISTGNI